MPRLRHHRQNISAALFILLTLLVLYHGLLRADFLLKDDWAAVPLTQPEGLHPQVADVEMFDNFWNYGVQAELNVGRFRPVYWLIYTLEAQLFYPDAALWYAETLLLGYLACLFFYFGLRGLNFSTAAAMVATIPVMLTGMRLWFQLSLAEEPALLFTAIALWSVVRAARTPQKRWDVLAVIALVLAGLCKETFILLAAPLLLLRVYLTAEGTGWLALVTALRANIRLIGVWVIVFGGLSAGAAALLMSGGYGSGVVGSVPVWQRFSPLLWIEMLLPLRLSFAYWIPAAGLLLVLPLLRESRWRWHTGIFIVLFLLWTAPQFVLYAKTGFADSHYFFPTALALAAVNGAGMELLIRRAPRPVWTGAVLLVLALLVYRAPQNMSFVERHAAYTRATMQLVRETRQVVNERGGDLVLVTEPWRNVPFAFAVFLSNGLISIPQIYFDPLEDGRFDPLWQAEEAAYIHGRWFPTAVQINPAAVQVLAVFAAAEDYPALAYDWFTAEEWQAFEIIEPYTMREIRLRPPALTASEQQYRYTVFVRR